jgi:dolichol-phosphate mannosyltransferase
MTPPHLSILLPVRNETANLQLMVKVLRALVSVPYEVLVICDSPDDASIPIVEGLRPRYHEVRLVLNQNGRGIINALKAGVEAASGEYVLIFAADELGPTLAIHSMLELAQAGCEFVSCTRYAHGGRRLGGSQVGGALSRVANWAFYYLSACAFTDATTGIKLFRREVFARLNLQARPVGWAVAFEMTIKAQLLGLKLGEVPITSIDRLYGGESTFHLGAWTWEYWRWFVWGVWALRAKPAVWRGRLTLQHPRTPAPEGFGFIGALALAQGD